MKLEEVLPHLRAGGKVIVIGALDSQPYSLGQLLRRYIAVALLDLDFEIVKDPYKAEHLVEKNPDYDYTIDGNQYTTFTEILPELGTKYKVTIEEITE